MIEKRKLPHGTEEILPLGLGMGGIHAAPPEEIRKTIEVAIDRGINFFDLCAGGASVYEPFGKAVRPVREKVYFQLHFGAVYDASGEYGWSRDLGRVKATFDFERKALDSDYADFGFLHCVDEENDFLEMRQNGILDFLLDLKAKGVIRHLGFSSHTPSVANRILDEVPVDMMMFSINPAYDMECGDEYGIGLAAERAALFRRAQAEGVGISVMKPFHGGQLLSEKTSPFCLALTKNQCLQYVLDRPGVIAAVPGVRGMKDLEELLPFLSSSEEENDYSEIGAFTPESARGNCVYCNHCLPCPAGIDIGLVNKYYDLARTGDRLAFGHYGKLVKNATACLSCGHCDRRCPFGVPQEKRMKEIAAYFQK